VLEPVTQRLHVLFVILGPRNVGSGDMRLRRDTAGTLGGQRVSGHAMVDDTLAGQTGDVRDTGDGSAVLADRRERRQRKHASTT
jgi:hypothetical protein